jgi:hypothetical protein
VKNLDSVPKVTFAEQSQFKNLFPALKWTNETYANLLMISFRSKELFGSKVLMNAQRKITIKKRSKVLDDFLQRETAAFVKIHTLKKWKLLDFGNYQNHEHHHLICLFAQQDCFKSSYCSACSIRKFLPWLSDKVCS